MYHPVRVSIMLNCKTICIFIFAHKQAKIKLERLHHSLHLESIKLERKN